MNVAIIILLVVLAIIACCLPSASSSAIEPVGHDSFQPTADPVQEILDYRPNQPSPVDLLNTQPYHLLSDIMEQPRVKESISCVNSRSCYATDFQRTIEKTGNYKQMTNNYKRKYPDSCSGLEQELTLNFYKVQQ
jgi:hypothetical protein